MAVTSNRFNESYGLNSNDFIEASEFMNTPLVASDLNM